MVDYAILPRSLVKVGKSEAITEPSLSVFQWNVLCDFYAKDTQTMCEAQYIEWSFRKNTLLKVLEANPVDIICLQEVDHYLDFWKPQLEQRGFTGVWKQKPNRESNDGCLLYWKSAKFVLKSAVPVELCDKEFGLVTDHPHIGLMAELVTNDGFNFVVATTHLKAGGYSLEQTRLAQAATLLKSLYHFAGEKPCIITGDFNSGPKGPVYKMLKEGKISGTVNTTHLSHPFKLNSAYQHLPGEVEAPYTLFDVNGKKTLDFIWYTEGHFQVVNLLEIPNAALIAMNTLPNKLYPSDHLALFAELKVVKK